MQQPDFGRIMALLRSPAGQQLVDYVKNNGTDSLQSAVIQASAGDMEGAKTALSPILADPRVKDLLEQLGGMS